MSDEEGSVPGETGDSDFDAQELLARLRAQSDQAIAGNVEFARMVASYFFSLVTEGVPPDYALQLTMSWQTAIIYMPKPEAPE